MTGVGYALLSLLWARALMVDVEELEAVVPLVASYRAVVGIPSAGGGCGRWHGVAR